MSAPQVDERAIAYVARYGEEGFRDLIRAGVTSDYFDQDYRHIWEFILRMKRDHDSMPSKGMLSTRFEFLELPNIRGSDLPLILQDLTNRYKFTQMLLATNAMHTQLGSGWDSIDDVLQKMISTASTLLNADGTKTRLVDLFSTETSDRIIAEMAARRERTGIPTGIPMLDAQTGGLFPGHMVVMMGRTAQGKTWLNLLAVANAIIAGKSVVLYPLEMTLYETATRLYTLFSAITNPDRVLSNRQLTYGQVTSTRLRAFLEHLEGQYGGRLLISDTATLADPYTIERISAEVEAARPDMFWIDYITLLKSGNGEKGWEAVQRLSHGVKMIAQKVNCVGGCSAQVNRAALEAGAGVIPRLEHVAYGDSISQDADLVISMAKRRRQKKDVLMWALVKNRHGPEIGAQMMEFDPDIGHFAEIKKEKKVAEVS